jgi:hypothetical protein
MHRNLPRALFCLWSELLRWSLEAERCSARGHQDTNHRRPSHHIWWSTLLVGFQIACRSAGLVLLQIRLFTSNFKTESVQRKGLSWKIYESSAHSYTGEETKQACRMLELLRTQVGERWVMKSSKTVSATLKTDRYQTECCRRSTRYTNTSSKHHS